MVWAWQLNWLPLSPTLYAPACKPSPASKTEFPLLTHQCLFSAYGFPNNLETFGLISGLWTSSFALGAFIGPSISGILYDNIGFRNSSMFVFAIHLLVGVTVTIFLVCGRRKMPYVEIEEVKLPNGELSTSIAKSPQNSATESMNR